YREGVLSDAPAAYWRLGEASGTVAADVVGGNPGAYAGGVTPNQPGAVADGNRAVLLNGSTGAIQVSNPTFSLAGDLTIELWLNVTLGGRQTLLSKGYQNELELTLESNGQLNFYHGN